MVHWIPMSFMCTGMGDYNSCYTGIAWTGWTNILTKTFFVQIFGYVQGQSNKSMVQLAGQFRLNFTTVIRFIFKPWANFFILIIFNWAEKPFFVCVQISHYFLNSCNFKTFWLRFKVGLTGRPVPKIYKINDFETVANNLYIGPLCVSYSLDWAENHFFPLILVVF